VTTEKLRRSQAQEKRGAEFLGGRLQPASGALPGAPNDVLVSGRFLVEYKRTDGLKSITLQAARLTQLEVRAIERGILPFLGFQVGARGDDWYALPNWALQELIADA
jgi:hypothetical protein